MAMLLFNESALMITSRRKESGEADGGISMKRLTLERSVFLLLSDVLVQHPDKIMHKRPRIVADSHLCLNGSSFRGNESQEGVSIKYRNADVKQKEYFSLATEISEK